MDRSTAMEKLNKQEDPEIVSMVWKKLESTAHDSIDDGLDFIADSIGAQYI